MNQPDDELLRRYLAGKADAEERARVEAWLADDPDRWAVLADLDYAATDAALSDAAVGQAASTVWARLQQSVSPDADLGAIRGVRVRGRPSEFSISHAPRWAGALRVAAVLVAVLGAGTVTAMWLRSHRPHAAASTRLAATTAGERATFGLPDGTRVMLGVASTLRYPADFGTGSREITLDGEAYFDVVHDGRHPFVVHAGSLVAKDLGTRFTVRLYPEDRGARVVVREGRVAMGTAQGAGTVVAPGQEGRLAANGSVALTRADTAAAFAWLTGRLVLQGAPLRDALPELSRWFDLDFRLADAGLGDIPLTVTLTSRPTPATLRTLAAALGLELTQQDRLVTLRAMRPRP